MRAATWVSIGCLAATLASGCGDDDGAPAVETVTQLVGPDGATVELSGGGKVTIPAGALTQEVSIKITKLEPNDVAALPSHMEAAGKPYAFEPHGQVFEQPVKIEVPYEGEATDVRPMKLPNEIADTTEWTTVFPNEKDEPRRKLSMDTTSFSVVLAARPRRMSGVIVLPDGAVMPEDAGTPDSGNAGAGGDAGTGGGSGTGGSAGDGGTGGTGGSGGSSGSGASTQWLHQFGDSSDEINGVAEDSEGNVYVVGSTELALVTDQPNAGTFDAFVRKYSSTGTPLWTHQLGSTLNDIGQSVVVDGDRVIATGTTGGVLDQQTSAGSHDSFVRVFDLDGTEIWTRQFGTNGSDTMYGLAVDGDRNILVAGVTTGTFTGQTAAGGNDAFVRKYDSEGTEVWTRQFGSTSADRGYGVAVDSDENVLVVGMTQGTFADQTSAGGNDMFVRKYDSEGTEVWTRQFGTADQDLGRAVTAASNGDVVVTGYTRDTFADQTSAGGYDVVVRKYDAAGAEVWTLQFGTPGSDYVYAAAADAEGNVAVIGQTEGTLPGLTTAGSQDIFVRVYDTDGTERFTRQFGTRGTDQGLGVAMGAGRRLVVGGRAGSIFPGQMNQSTVPAALVTTFNW